MSACPSCGGIIGRDCFNPQECAEISFHQQQQQVHQQFDNEQAIAYLAQRIELLETRIGQLEKHCGGLL